MRVLDLFSGAAGGWSLGLHRAGFVTVAACEIDPQRRAAYANNNPGVRLYDDVRTLTAGRLLADLGFIPECVVGSPPCQDASTANHKGRGIDGERTGLFREYVRIVGEVRPRWCAAENVPGIRTRGADWVLDALEALGYACWPLVVGAVHAGAPHLRRRVWFIAADADQVGRKSKGKQWPGTEQQRLAVAANDPDAQRDDEHGVAVDGEVGLALGVSAVSDEEQLHVGEPGGIAAAARAVQGDGEQRERVWPDARQLDDAGDANEARLAFGQGERGDHAAQLAAVERAVGSYGLRWNAGPARHLGMAAGIPAGLARACMAAYGDSVLPQITEAIGNAIRRTDEAMRAAA